MIKAVIFDIDGVLIDSFDSNLKFYQDICRQAGYRIPTVRQYRRMFHLTLRDTIKRLTGSDDKRELKRVWRIAMRINKTVAPVKMPEGSLSTIKRLAKRYRLGVVTGRTLLGANQYFKYANNKKYFKVIVHAHHYDNPKPHPEPLLICARRLKVIPSDAVYVGDQKADILAAKAAGMKIILYAKNPLPGADGTIYSFQCLPQSIAKLNSKFTTKESSILELIRKYPGIRPKDLHYILGINHSAGVRNSLIKKSLVKKKRHGAAVHYYPVL